LNLALAQAIIAPAPTWLLLDEKGKSYISAEDFAVAVFDETENPVSET
jgi:putative NADH-flavin reductase